MELKEMIKVMQHYENGGEVEYSNRESNIWSGASTPVWNWVDYDYRIREQKQKVTIEKWLVKNSNNEYFIREAERKHLLYDNKVKLLETYEVEL